MFQASVKAATDYEPIYDMAPRTREATSTVSGLDYYGERLPAPIPGGNFFDFVPLSATGLAVAVGDCMGREIAATFATCTLRALFRNGAAQDRDDVTQLMRQANRAVYRLSGGDSYSALFYGQIDAALGELHYINAGHEPPLLIRASSGRVHNLESNGTLLGLTDRPIFRRRSVAMEPGDVLIVFTDGVAESLNVEGQPFSRNDILKIVRRHPSASARELASELLSAVTRWGSAAPSQDRTLAVIKLKERAEQISVEEAEEETVQELAFCAA